METTSVPVPASTRRSLNWSIDLSVLMIVAGLLAIVVPPAAGIAVTLIVGWLLMFSGAAHFVYAWHTRRAGTVVWEILVGVAYLVVGFYVLWNPVLGLASLTFALAIYLFVECILEFVMGWQLRPRPGSGMLYVDGIITLILAILILRTWPSSSGWILGLLVGISMLFSGITRLAISVAAKRALAQAV
jgi:uncharacterized membrane protein HdeD (DUF308 family)